MKQRRRAACLLTCAMLCMAAPAFAQVPDEATRTAARALGTSGVEAYQAGDFPMASDRLEKAYGILRVPSLGLWSARALVKNGKWVEAADRYLEVTSLQVPTGEYAVQKQAQAEAEAELAALKPKIPVLAVKSEGAALAEIEVSIDGRTVPAAFAGEGRLVNPGKHVVEGKRAGETARAEVTLGEGQRETAVLTFGAKAPAATAAGAAKAPSEAAAGGGSSAGRTAGYVSLGAGIVGLGVGTVTGILAMGKKGQIDQNPNCTDNRCSPSQEDQVDSYMSMRTVSTAGFIAGGTLTALGVVLLLTSTGSGAGAEAYLSPSSAGVRGKF